jgi:protein disulfide-isomerase
MIRSIAALFLLSLTLTAGAAEARWLFDFAEAQALAKKQDKLVLINFTGSDWCGWCMKLKKEVFVTPEFNDYARSNLVLVEIDQPRSKPFSLEQLALNTQIQEKYRAEGFPTLIALNSSGQEVWRLGGYAALPPADWGKMFDNLKKGVTTPPPIGTLAQAQAQVQK